MQMNVAKVRAKANFHKKGVKVLNRPTNSNKTTVELTKATLSRTKIEDTASIALCGRAREAFLRLGKIA